MGGDGGVNSRRADAAEGVAIGIALDTIYSRAMGYLDTVSCERILALLERLGFELFANELIHVDADGRYFVLNGLEEFREHLGGELSLPGHAIIGESHLQRLEQALEIANAALPPLKDFVLPGGSRAAAAASGSD